MHGELEGHELEGGDAAKVRARGCLDNALRNYLLGLAAFPLPAPDIMRAAREQQVVLKSLILLLRGGGLG